MRRFRESNSAATLDPLAARRTRPTGRVAASGAADADAGHAPVWAGRCRTVAGEALTAAGRVDAAREQLRQAGSELDALGALGPRDVALRLLRRLGDRPRPRARVPSGAHGDDRRLAPLTPREREVAALVAAGHTNAQIAHRLQLSERTVHKHVSNLLGKLGMNTRSQVIRLLAGD